MWHSKNRRRGILNNVTSKIIKPLYFFHLLFAVRTPTEQPITLAFRLSMAQNTTTTATSSSITPSSQSLLPPPSGCQVRCAGCHWILTVASGMTEFSCPKCQLPQMLPPELMIPGRRPPPPAQGIDPTKIQLPCARCKAILNVPHGLTRFACPQCGVDLAVDMSKLHNYMSAAGSALGTGQGFVNPGNLSEPEPEAIEEIDEVFFLTCSGNDVSFSCFVGCRWDFMFFVVISNQ